MSTQGFQVDVFNNTSRTVTFLLTGNTFLNGAAGQYTILPHAWVSAQNGNAPLALELLNDAGTLEFQVQLGSASGSTGNFTLEFDGTQLSNFPGMAFYGSAGDIADPILTSEVAGVGYIYPLLYMNQLYAGNPLAVLMLVEAIGASPDVDTPYPVS